MKLKTIRNRVEEKQSIDLSKIIRERPYVYCRAIYYKLCKEFTGATLSDIARSLNKNHATVLHGIKLFNTVIRNEDKFYYALYCQIKDELTAKPKYFDEPVIYWMEKYHDLGEEYDKLVDEYDILFHKLSYLKGKVKGLGYKYPIVDEPIRRYTKKETRRQEEQWSDQGDLSRSGETNQGQGEGSESNDPSRIKEDVRV